MSDPAIPPCREWLGIDPTDLPIPHRVVGVSEHERDPLVIVRAADRRFAALRAIPGGHAAERDALMAQVEAARDALLAACAVTLPARTGSPPPVPAAPATVMRPPPVPAVPAWQVAAPTAPTRPPPVPPAPDQETAPDMAFPGVLPPLTPRRRPAGQAAAVGATMLMVAVAGAAVYLAWPHLQRSSPQVARRPEPQRLAPPRNDSPTDRPTDPRAPESTGSGPGPDSAARIQRPSDTGADPPPDRQPARRPGRPPEPAPQPEPEPVPDSAAAPPAVDPQRVRDLVGAAITRAFAALRERDTVTAKQELDAVAAAALDDQQATDRLQGWRQLALYAGEYPRYRDQALASAASTAATYDLGGRQIGVVEFDSRLFIYRDSRNPGRNLRARRDAIPADIEAVLVGSWFAKDGRPANHLYLGAAALSRREPDLRAARREWETAAAGGEEDATVLLGVLADPVLH